MDEYASDYPYGVVTGLATGDIRPPRRCQYPVAGNGAATRFCNRPARPGRSYCDRHLRRCIETEAAGVEAVGDSVSRGAKPGPVW